MRTHFFATFIFIALFWTVSIASAQTITGTVEAQDRSFSNLLSGPGAKVFAGTVLHVAVTGGQADINFVHRENRKCKWYGKCWYERWIDHNFRSPGTWPVEYQLVSATNSNEVVASGRFETGKGTLEVPIKSLRAYSSAYLLQGRLAGDIDPNRTSGAFSITVTVEAAPRLAAFPRYLNNGSFLPSAADLALMLQLDTWSTKQGSDTLVKSIINYAQNSFPSSTDADEHYKLLEIARSLQPNSSQVSRALASYHVEVGDYSTAGDELLKTIKEEEARLKTATRANARDIRVTLAELYAQLAALAEREGTLLSPNDYGRMEALFATALEHARVANGRDALARIHTNRAKILRKSNRTESLVNATESFEKAADLLGRPLDNAFLTMSPDRRHALTTVTPMSTGIIFEPVTALASDVELEGMRLASATVRTNKGLSALDISTDFILVDDGGVLSKLTLDGGGDVVLESIDNVQFESAQTFKNGILGRSRDRAGNVAFQYIYAGQAPAALSDIEVRNEEKVLIENADAWEYAAASGADKAMLVKRGLSPEVRLYTLSALGAHYSVILVGAFADAQIRQFAISDLGDRFAAIVSRSDRYDLVTGIMDGSEPRIHYSFVPGTPSAVALDSASGIVFSMDGSFVVTVSGNKMLTVNLASPDSAPVESTLNIWSSKTVVGTNNFGRDNTGAIVAGAEDRTKVSGFLFRLPFTDGSFALDAQRYPLSNRVLEKSSPIFVNIDERNFVGLARPSDVEASVLNVDTGLIAGSRSIPISVGARLLNGGRYVASVDLIANAVLLYDLTSSTEPLIVSAKIDLVEIALTDLQRQRLRPRIVAGQSANEWFVLWENVEDDSLEFVSKYVGVEKSGSTVRLDLEDIEGLASALTATSEQLGQPKAHVRFALSDGGERRQVAGRDAYIITVRSALSEKSKADLDALPEELRGEVQMPVFDISEWPPRSFTSLQPRNGEVVGYDLASGDTLRLEAGTFVLRRGDGSADGPVTLPIDESATMIGSAAFVPFVQQGEGNLYGGALIYLLSRGDEEGIRYVFLGKVGGVEVACEACMGQWAQTKTFALSRSELSEAQFLSQEGAGHFIVSRQDKLVVYSRAGSLVEDELPAGLPVSIFSADRHLTITGSSRVNIFNKIQAH